MTRSTYQPIIRTGLTQAMGLSDEDVERIFETARNLKLG
jgi:hypothetical protein